MKKTGKLLWILAIAVVLRLFTGCAPAADAPPKSDGYEKFCRLEIGMSPDQVNEILGPPVREEKDCRFYTVTVNGRSLELRVYLGGGQVTGFTGDFSDSLYRGEFADSRTDLSAAGRLEDHGLSTYDDCAAAFGTPGYLIGADSSGVKEYLWVDEKDGYIHISFLADGAVKAFGGFG